MEIDQTEILALAEKALPLSQKANNFVVTSDDEVATASLFLAQVKDQLNIIEAKKVQYTKPLNESLKAINADFKRIAEPLKEADSIVREKILSYRRVQNEIIAKEEARRQKISDAATVKRGDEGRKIEIDRVEKTIGFSQARKVKKYRVVDFDVVPRIYKMIDDREVKESMREYPDRTIPGIEFYEEEILTIRS